MQKCAVAWDCTEEIARKRSLTSCASKELTIPAGKVLVAQVSLPPWRFTRGVQMGAEVLTEVSASDSGNFFLQVAQAIWTELSEELQYPWDDNFKREIAAGFREYYTGLPNCVGAIDGTHFNMCQPILERLGWQITLTESTITPLSCKRLLIAKCVSLTTTLVSQALFMMPECCPNQSCIVRQQTPTCLRGLFRTNSFSFKPFILGAARYPLTSWLMIPFKATGNMSPAKDEYNQWHSSTRMVVERAFGLLKNRWRLLLGKVQIRAHCVCAKWWLVWHCTISI